MKSLLAKHEVEYIRKASVNKYLGPADLWAITEDAEAQRMFYNGSLVPPDEEKGGRAVWRPEKTKKVRFILPAVFETTVRLPSGWDDMDISERMDWLEQRVDHESDVFSPDDVERFHHDSDDLYALIKHIARDADS